MLKFWVFVLFGLIQVAVVLSFIFPDDDYFKQTKLAPVPSYATDSWRFTSTPRYASTTTRKPTPTRRYTTTTRTPTPTPLYASTTRKPTPTRRYATTTRTPTPTPHYETTTRVRRFSRRPSTTTTTTASINDIDIDIAIFNSCMESCPTTTEYDPVCGTDRDTYPNKSTLECIRRCGIDVEMDRLGRC